MKNDSLAKLLDHAFEQHQAGRLAEAETLYRNILARDPQSVDALHLLGVIFHQTGKYTESAELIGRAAGLAPKNPAIHSNLGEAQRLLGRLDESVASLRRALALQPNYPEALHNLGVALSVQGKLEAAVECLQQAIAFRPGFAEAQNSLGSALQRQGRLNEAIQCFQQAVALEPGLARAWNNLGNAHQVRRHHDEALVCFRRALALAPGVAETYFNLANLLKDTGHIADAIAAFQQALALNPQFADAWLNLGNVHFHCGQLDDAIVSYQRALALNPHLTIALSNLGSVFNRQGKSAQARECLERAVELAPDLAETHNNFGLFLMDTGCADEALACFARALALKPDLVEAHNNLGTLHNNRAEYEQAIACYRRVLALRPDRADVHSNLIMTLHFCPDGAERIPAEVADWERMHAAPMAKFVQPHRNDRSPARRLKIGYISPDFRDHVIGLNLLPLFRHHDHDQFEIFCYAQGSASDSVTAEFRSLADHWRAIDPLSDVQLAELVRQDGIDVLLDLTLHLANNRLPAFACRPAPVQVSFAGYPGGTGLRAIDYHLTDPYLEPATTAKAEAPDAPFPLPDSFWCYSPSLPGPDVGGLPALSAGHVTFGCLNNYGKINATMLQLWAQVLRAIPHSRLLLLAAEGTHRQRAWDVLAAEGIAPERLRFATLRPRPAYLALYREIDLGLDSLPYNGHTTSLDSYWMGVPVVSLVGSSVVGRAGWSQLSNLQLTELVAHTPDRFVAIACSLARDLPRLSILRESLRERMTRSPLMNAPRFAQHIEAAYRTMWRRWCSRRD